MILSLGAMVENRVHVVQARAIVVSPAVILMDEPCSALDPIATTCIGLGKPVDRTAAVHIKSQRSPLHFLSATKAALARR